MNRDDDKVLCEPCLQEAGERRRAVLKRADSAKYAARVRVLGLTPRLVTDA